MTRWIWLAAVLLLAAAGAWYYQAVARPGPILQVVGETVRQGELTLAPIRLRNRSYRFLPTYVAGEEGRLFAPLDHERPDGRTVELHLLRFAPSSNDAHGWPTVVLVDGPSDTAVGFASGATFDFIQALRGVGEVIVLDQRGSRYSEPFLECPGTYAFPVDEPNTVERRGPLFAAYVRQCIRAWAGTNLGLFTPRDTAHDIEDVRRALGAERINLVAVGEGTRAALDYLRLYPNRAEQAVMVGAQAPNQADVLPADVEAVLDRVATAIATDVTVGRAFPDLRSAVDDLVAEVERAPVTVNVPAGGETVEVVLGAYDVISYVIFALRDRDRIATLPRVLAAMQVGDFRELAGLALPSRSDNRIATLAQIAVDCSGKNAPERADRLAEQVPASPLGNYVNLVRMAACPIWPAALLPASYRDPVLSATPTLFVSGTWDIDTPPENINEILDGFLSAWTLSIDGATHRDLLTGSPQIAEAVTAFLRGDTPAADSIVLTPIRFAGL